MNRFPFLNPHHPQGFPQGYRWVVGLCEKFGSAIAQMTPEPPNFSQSQRSATQSVHSVPNHSPRKGGSDQNSHPPGVTVNDGPSACSLNKAMLSQTRALWEQLVKYCLLNAYSHLEYFLSFKKCWYMQGKKYLTFVKQSKIFRVPSMYIISFNSHQNPM